MGILIRYFLFPKNVKNFLSWKIKNSEILFQALKIAISDPVYEAKVGDIVNFTASQIDEDVVIAINVSIYK